jgi:hypothetical protein
MCFKGMRVLCLVYSFVFVIQASALHFNTRLPAAQYLSTRLFALVAPVASMAKRNCGKIACAFVVATVLTAAALWVHKFVLGLKERNRQQLDRIQALEELVVRKRNKYRVLFQEFCSMYEYVEQLENVLAGVSQSVHRIDTLNEQLSASLAAPPMKRNAL